ncbi:energy transducer TonB [Ancylomarina salipaludis]|uniref:Energy transducer TonB n=1 Tax=Ancylomarina salipaludis TaxID=2501299 RepID=A0A4Q1JNY2_9BACT|nr:energy transducer TonB [Ancylomarina salipaludis]RXQ96512.1 energy transducer TonB [Ancylomarina salipaludis]
MEVKKSQKADLENKRSLFLQIGLVLTLAMVFLAFEWRVETSEANVLDTVQELQVDDEIIPVTTTEPIKPPPPPPPAPRIADVIDIVDNDEEIDEVLEIVDSGTDMDEEVDIQVKEDIEDDDEEKIFVIAENMPEFPGGDAALFSWISNNIKYPVIAQENGITGRVYLNFVVNKQGGIENVKVTRGVDPSLDKEAIRVINKMPKWIPGKQRGKPVNVSFSVPINFQLQ